MTRVIRNEEFLLLCFGLLCLLDSKFVIRIDLGGSLDRGVRVHTARSVKHLLNLGSVLPPLNLVVKFGMLRVGADEDVGIPVFICPEVLAISLCNFLGSLFVGTLLLLLLLDAVENLADCLANRASLARKGFAAKDNLEGLAICRVLQEVGLETHGRIEIFLEALETAGEETHTRLVFHARSGNAGRLPHVGVFFSFPGTEVFGCCSGSAACEDVHLLDAGIVVLLSHCFHLFGQIDHVVWNLGITSL